MQETFSRTAELQRGDIDMSTGQFPLTLATDGEASDGHIIRVEGVETPEALPMLFGHQSTVQVPSLGRITDFGVEQRGGFSHLRGIGNLNLNGDPEVDALVGIRIGIAQLIADGDLTGMSIRWDPIGEPKLRRNLPQAHPAHGSGPGYYFENSIAREGSVVGLGAEPKSLIGRSEAAHSDLERVFWRQLAGDSTEDNTHHMAQDLMNAVTALQSAARDLQHGHGVGMSSIINVIGADPLEELVPYDYGSGLVYLPRAAHDAITTREIESLRAACEMYRMDRDADAWADRLVTDTSTGNLVVRDFTIVADDETGEPATPPEAPAEKAEEKAREDLAAAARKVKDMRQELSTIIDRTHSEQIRKRTGRLSD